MFSPLICLLLLVKLINGGHLDQCIFQHHGLTFNMTGQLRALDEFGWEYLFEPCSSSLARPLPLRCAGQKDSPAFQITSSECLALGSRSSCTVGSLPVPVNQTQQPGFSLRFSGGAGCGNNVFRTIILYATCSSSQTSPYVSVEGPCAYEMHASLPMACPLQCARGLNGEVCSGHEHGVCVVKKKLVSDTEENILAACSCNKGFTGPMCIDLVPQCLVYSNVFILGIVFLGLSACRLFFFRFEWLNFLYFVGTVSLSIGLYSGFHSVLSQGTSLSQHTRFFFNDSFGKDALFDGFCALAADCREELYSGFLPPYGEPSHHVAVMDTNCGGSPVEFSVDDNKAAQNWLHVWQHPRNCSNVPLGVVSGYHNGGIGSTLHFVVYTMLRILAEGRVAVLGPGWAWSDCALGSPECYFEAVSSCRLEESQNIKYFAVEYPPAPTARIMQVPFSRKSWAFARSHVLRYLLRPRPELTSFIQSLGVKAFPLGLPRPIAALFVRWTDKSTESSVFNVSNYFDLLLPVAAKLRLRDVYFGSDDEAALKEAKTLYGGRFNLHSLPIQRGFSWMAHDKSSPLGAQMRNSLADLFVQVHADVWVGTLSSNWCRLVDELRSAMGKTCLPYLDVDGRYLTEGARIRI